MYPVTNKSLWDTIVDFSPEEMFAFKGNVFPGMMIYYVNRIDLL